MECFCNGIYIENGMFNFLFFPKVIVSCRCSVRGRRIETRKKLQ